MALSIIKEPKDFTGAFGVNQFVIQTTNSTLKLIRSRTYYDVSDYIETFAPVFSNRAYFNMTPVYSALMPFDDQLIFDFRMGVGDITTGFQTQNPEYQAGSEKLIIASFDEIHPDTGNPIGGSNIFRIKKVLRGVDGRYEKEFPYVVTTPPPSGGNIHSTGVIAMEKNPIPGKRTFRYVFPQQKVPIVMYTNVEENLELEGTGFTATSIIEREAPNYTFAGMWRVPDIPLAVQSIGCVNEAIPFPGSPVGSVPIASEYIYIYYYPDTTCYPRKKVLYFQNRYGGWDFYPFVDYEETYVTEKDQLTITKNLEGDKQIMQLVDGSIKELKLFGKPGNYEQVFHLRDLITSPVVIDEQGQRVRVLNERITLVGPDEGIITPEIRIQYLKENAISY